MINPDTVLAMAKRLRASMPPSSTHESPLDYTSTRCLVEALCAEINYALCAAKIVEPDK